MFCERFKEHKRIILETAEFFIIEDEHPVNRGHLLIISRRHREDIFSLLPYEWVDMQVALNEAKAFADGAFEVKGYSPEGYNIGVNCGAVAGQTIFHLHIHLVPRYIGDVPDPRGGIRNFKEPLVRYNP
ncbi:MAG: HIT family protein [bacterium]|nr:HIT family protein [bacterium]